MARRVFFSFHYERDVWRANVVRKSWVTKPDRESAGFIDAADFEKLKREGDLAVKKWINDQLKGTSVTAVLIGYETYLRRWVRYEIVKSFDKGNGLLGIYIHNIGDIDFKGESPFKYIGVYIGKYGVKSQYMILENGTWKRFYDYPDCSRYFDKKYWTQDIYTLDILNFPIKIYDWVYDDGYNNLGNWVEEAARQTGR